jgi:transketolase
MVAVNDKFGESGTGEELLTKYHINTADIVKAVELVISRK